MIFNFDPFGNIEFYVLEIKTGNQIQRQNLQGSPSLIKTSVLQLMKQASQSQSPIKIRIIKEEKVWDSFRQEQRQIENYVQFANKAYIKNFSEEFKGDKKYE